MKNYIIFLITFISYLGFSQNPEILLNSARQKEHLDFRNLSRPHNFSAVNGSFEERTEAQMLAITTPKTGRIVYNTTKKEYYYFDGFIWIPFAKDKQTLSLSSNILSISNGNNVNLSSYLDNTDAQDLTLTGDILSLTNDVTPVTLPYWRLGGNAGTTAGTNFLGTTDAQDLVFKTNNSEIARARYDLQSWNFGGDGTASGQWSFNSGRLGTSSGIYSFNSGLQGIASGYASFNSGHLGTASGDASFNSGYQGLSQVFASFNSGYQGTASGDASLNSAIGGFARSFGEHNLGIYSTDYTPASTTAWRGTDRLFNVGNGTSTPGRSDAFTILKNGNTGIGINTPAQKLHIGTPTIANTGGIRLPITSTSPAQTGQPIGVDANGDIVRLAPTTFDATNTYADIITNVQYTGVNTTIATGEKMTGIYRGVTIYRFISNTTNAYGYPTEDSFYSDINLTTKITQRNQ